MLLQYGFCICFALYCNAMDIKFYRVPNRAVLLFILLGIIWNSWQLGVLGLLESLAGGGMMLILFPLFVLRMLGAGDVKALIAVGCMVRFPESIFVLLYSLLGAGMVAFWKIIFQKNGRSRVKYFFSYCQLCWYSRKIQPYAETLNEENGGFPFTLGITVGLLLSLLRLFV